MSDTYCGDSTPEEVHGSDTFFVRDGKIVAQTVVMLKTPSPQK
jgi:hypothetical protein